MLDIEYIKNNYRNLNELDLINLAKNPKGVRPELVPILLEILKERNIGLEYMDSILLETNYFLKDERAALIHRITNSICTNCSIANPIKGYSFRTITAYIYLLMKSMRNKLYAPIAH